MERTKCSACTAEIKNRIIQAEGEKSGSVGRGKGSLKLMGEAGMKLTDSKPSQKRKQTSFSCISSLRKVLQVMNTVYQHSNSILRSVDS